MKGESGERNLERGTWRGESWVCGGVRELILMTF